MERFKVKHEKLGDEAEVNGIVSSLMLEALDRDGWGPEDLYGHNAITEMIFSQDEYTPDELRDEIREYQEDTEEYVTKIQS